MFLQIHPTQSEALTASETTLTCWSLTTNPAIILAQISTAPGTLFEVMIDPGGRWLTHGGIAPTPDGKLFALEQPWMRMRRSSGSRVIEWRRWHDLLPERTMTVPQTGCSITSMDSSPNGRWLVIDNDDHLFLLDWHTGEVMSRHFSNGYATSGLAFDLTSTFVAGLTFADGGGDLMLWRLDPAERFVPRPEREEWLSHKRVPQDEVKGSVALTLVHKKLDRTGIAWDRDLADTAVSRHSARIAVWSFSASNPPTVSLALNSSPTKCCLAGDCGAFAVSKKVRVRVPLLPMVVSCLFPCRGTNSWYTVPRMARSCSGCK